MNPTLETNPKLGAIALDELLDTMEYHSDDDSLRRVIRDVEQYSIDLAPYDTDYDRRTRTRTMPSSIHTRPWSAASEIVCMLYDLRLDATKGDLEFDLNTRKDLAPIREAHTPEIKQAQTQVFDAFTNYLQVLKDSIKPLGATKDLQDQPSKACVILDEVLSYVDECTRWYDLEKIKTSIHFSIRDDMPGATREQKHFNKVYNGVVEAFMAFGRYCEDKPSPRDSSDYGTFDDEQDR
ncbi:hypothetical protein AWC38_SpisGene21902 [Stylophora pistillata]|uniref:Uncharacterized protein n=1 Tax=Stylophora pistillata TaxID=50429 RepID=A0A2B4RBV1_STYPI|nr:hypothetical protein AWC38_SpisGene21902 [Stylophora pistillata]